MVFTALKGTGAVWCLWTCSQKQVGDWKGKT